MKPKINLINFKILTVFFSIVIISFSFQNAFASESSTIFYSDKKLTWDDFQGNILSFSPNYGAVTYSDIKLYSSWKYSETSECNYEFEKVLAKAWFDKEASFVRPWVLAGTQSNWILNHEQRHFDIAVIHAEKFNQQSEVDFMGKQFSCTDGSRTLNKSEINSIADDQIREVYDKIRQKLRFMQQDYDSDTNHASSKDVQREWNNKIDSELKRLEGMGIKTIRDFRDYEFAEDEDKGVTNSQRHFKEIFWERDWNNLNQEEKDMLLNNKK